MPLCAQDNFLSEEEMFNEDFDQLEIVFDPLEDLNRHVFKFNDFVYINILQPLADSYQAITPDSIEECLSNFLYNLNYPVRFTSNLLQGRLHRAWIETGRFTVNSSIGLAGIMTPADQLNGLSPVEAEDLGQALGSWGVSEGPYLVLPLLGPSNLRDLAGLLGDRAADPLKKPFSDIDGFYSEERLFLNFLELNVRSPDILKRYYQMKRGAIDPYISLKDSYTQFRRSAILE